jgi:hypothetical protein
MSNVCIKFVGISLQSSNHNMCIWALFIHSIRDYSKKTWMFSVEYFFSAVGKGEDNAMGAISSRLNPILAPLKRRGELF